MVRDGYTQTRTFTYSGSDLASTTNPENGTVTYTYNNVHQVTMRTDAKGQVTQYTYDAYGRLTQVSYPGGYPNPSFPGMNYYYDTNPFGSSQNTMGRLAAVTFGANAQPASSFRYTYSYSPAGRVQSLKFHTDLVGGQMSGPLDLEAPYQWDNEGRMTNVGGSGPAPTRGAS